MVTEEEFDDTVDVENVDEPDDDLDVFFDVVVVAETDDGVELFDPLWEVLCFSDSLDPV